MGAETFQMKTMEMLFPLQAANGRVIVVNFPQGLEHQSDWVIVRLLLEVKAGMNSWEVVEA